MASVRNVLHIYCDGSLLAAVQTSNLFIDCKHFVDMPLKFDVETTLSRWESLKDDLGRVDHRTLRDFVEQHFDHPGNELENWNPTDFDTHLNTFDAIVDPQYRLWAIDLHRKWPTLCRKVAQRVVDHPQLHSLIPLSNPFVVPGGRFREMYYWDSHFTIIGLIASGMFSTVRGMIDNMGEMIDKFGYVLNGNRIYYLNRSQPPLLAWSLKAYYSATNDRTMLDRALPWLERELAFFKENRSISVDPTSQLFQYRVNVNEPRPESYREDVHSAIHISDEKEKRRLWGDIAAAAESGRDFSSRWFSSVGPVAGRMGSTRTSQIVPVDLNAIMCGNLRILTELYYVVGRNEAAVEMQLQSETLRQLIYRVLWSDELGAWFDFDLASGTRVLTYSDTNLFPLYTGCTHDHFDATTVVSYLDKTGVLSFPGGLPSSLTTSGQQWDFPNAWAPTTWVVIQGLRISGQDQLALKLVDKWIKKNYSMWLSSGGRMFEKYNVESQCRKSKSTGGEYELQEGFGWTNGVILDILLTYSDRLSSSSYNDCNVDCECRTPSSSLHPVLLN